MRVYIAGAYTKGDVAVNVREAILAADGVAALGHTPYLPHLTHFWHIVAPHPWQFWLQLDLAWLDLCDCVLRLEGESVGADREVAYAQQHCIKVYYGLKELPCQE